MSRTLQDNHREQIAYRAMKESIDASHPAGWFVAILDDKIIAASADFHDLEVKLRAQGKEPRNTFVVQAGISHPEYVTIFL